MTRYTGHIDDLQRRVPLRTLATILCCFGFVLLVGRQTSRGSEPDAGIPGLVKARPAEGRFVETDQGFMVPYKATIPGTEVTFEMAPIPGGVLAMGSPPSEEKRRDDEGPQFEVKVAPFWMGTCEVT
jgi:sulfatase modifying factor 1